MRNKLLLSLTAFVVSALLLSALGEVVLRAVAPVSDPVPLGTTLPSSPRQYGLRPGAHAVQLGVDVVINSIGFREREYALEKPPGVRRIVVLGDSFTFGTGVEFADTFSKRLERRLNESGRPYQVINFGVSGYDTIRELATFREVAAAFKPDLVIVAYVLNDADPEVALASPRVVRADVGSLLTPLHIFLKDHSLLYRYLAPSVGALLARFQLGYPVGTTHEISRAYDEHSPGWVASRQALLDIAAGAREIGADVLVVVFPMMVEFSSYPLAHVHKTIIQFARSHGLAVLDLLPRFAGRDASELTVFLDGHPNARAHAIFADGIFEYLSSHPP